jgi:hypothetical protein
MFRYAQHDSGLQDDLYSIAGNLDAGLLEFSALRRARHQDRVCIVDMSINLPARWRLAQEIKAAATDGQMIHLAGTSGTGAHDYKFMITPECAVEKNYVGTGACFRQLRGKLNNCRCG